MKKYEQRGKASRLKKTPVIAGRLWSQLQKEPVQSEFSAKMIEGVFQDLFYGKRNPVERPVRMIISIPAKSDRAGRRKLRKRLKQMINPTENQ